MMTLRLSHIAGCALFAAAVPAAAQPNKPPQARNPQAIFGSVTENDLVELLKAEGHAIDKIHPYDEPSVRGKTAGGVLFTLTGTACDKKPVKNCQGIMMQVRYDSDKDVTTDRINDASLAQAAISTWWDKEDKTVGFTRYVVLDDGVTWMNIRQNLRVMLGIVPVAIKKVWPD